jgi:hypothetical protein
MFHANCIIKQVNDCHPSEQGEEMPMHTFILTLDTPEVTQAVEDALLQAGCNDGFLYSHDGVTYLDFEREGASLQEAIQSAIRDVQAAGYQAIRVD